MIVKRKAFTSDTPAIRAIWAASFPEDPPEVCDAFLTAVSLSDCLVAEVDGVVASMVFSVTAKLGEQRLQYIYAAATLPSHRGRGVFGELLRFALEQARDEGCVGSFLHPAEPSLAEYYARFGYRPWTYVERVRGTAGGMLALQPLSPEEYAVRRPLPPYAVAWPPSLLQYAAGCDTAYAAGNAVLLCDVQGETLLIKETLGDADPSAVCAALGCARYEWVRPAANGEVYTLLLPFAELPPPYIGPIFD